MQTSLSDLTPHRQVDKLIGQLRDKGISDPRVLEAIGQTPRHLFVDQALRYRAYEDVALPISESQTISQPYIVALMTERVLARRPLKSVLEIGTGCGYQTAILAQLFSRVCTIERIRTLSEGAVGRLKQLGIRNVEFQHGDGYVGWRERAPFDAIMITAAVAEPPKLLLDQLAPDGILVMPIGESHAVQKLVAVRKVLGEQKIEDLGDVRFVPLLRGQTLGSAG